MNDPITTTYLTQGVLGATVVVLAGVVVFLYRENKSLQTANDNLRDKMLVEAKAYAEKILELSAKLTDTIGQVNDLFSKNRGK